MTTLVCFLEETSARVFLEGVFSRLLPDGNSVKYVVFEGKQDLEKQIVRKLRRWQEPDSVFLVMRDQDTAICTTVKANLARLCNEAQKPTCIPDNIVNPSKELEKITGGIYQKIGGSREIGKVISLTCNSSHSFNALISGIQRLF